MGAGAAAGLGIAALSAAAGRSFRWARGLEDEFRAILGDSKGWEIAVLAFISGMAEEYLFRGALQENFGIWIAAAVFAVLHWPVSRAFFPWPIAAGAIGLALGGLRLWTNSLVAPAAAHGVINLINLWRLTRRGD
jgi:membrane protease YdiL (CAAX protease family)